VVQAGDKGSGLGWLPPSECTNSFQQFCAHANLFCDTAHLGTWQEAAGIPGRALDPAGTAALGRDSWPSFANADPSA
jgi:hypothetical protein